MRLNEQQKEAVEHYNGACAVIASAGSGKSTVLVERVKSLVRNHLEPQSSILAITFTSKTAKELKDRLEREMLGRVNVGTFHAICMRIMLQEGVDVRGRLVPLYKADNWFKEIDKKPNTEEILSFISYQKSYMRDFTDEFAYKDSDYSENQLRAFYKVYESNKSQEGLYDFDDYLLITLDLLQKNKGKYQFEHVLVDEHQDTNLVQNMILQEITKDNNIFAVFDPKQAIYSFRAGNIKYCMNFEDYWDNPKVINMNINYRSTKNVVESANKMIKPYFENYSHYVDAVSNNADDGEISLNRYITEEEEAIEVVNKIEEKIEAGTPMNEIAVLYRLNKQSIHIENELKRRNIEYDVANDSSFFKRREINAIINFLRLVINPHDEGALEEIFRFRTFPLKFFSNKLFEQIRHYSGVNNLTLFESLTMFNYDKAWQRRNALAFEQSINRLRSQDSKGVHVTRLIDNIVRAFDIEGYIDEKYTNYEEAQERKKSLETLKLFVKNNNLEQFVTYVYSATTKKKVKDNAVKLMTVHSAKGLEWDNVFLIGMNNGDFPHERSDIEEEARLFYVAVTRPKKNLYISELGEGSVFVKQYFD